MYYVPKFDFEPAIYTINQLSDVTGNCQRCVVYCSAAYCQRQIFIPWESSRRKFVQNLNTKNQAGQTWNIYKTARSSN